MSKSKKGFNISMDETLVYPSLAAEKRYPVRKTDWDRLKRLLGQVRPEANFWRAACPLFAGIAVAAGSAAYSFSQTEGISPWVVSSYAACAIFAFILAVILFIRDKKDTESSSGDIKSIIKDIEEIEAGFEREEQGTVSNSEEASLEALRASLIEDALRSMSEDDEKPK
ncbi:MAG: hypothetical protein ABH950_09130 [Candidatus Altiarchaeota archaeon]